MTGTHFSGISGHRELGITFPSDPKEGQEYFDNTTNTHYIYANSQWWGRGFTTSTSSSTSSSTSTTTSTSSTTTSTSTTTTSTSTTTTL